MNLLLYTVFSILLHIWKTETANILAISPWNSKSHNSIHQKIVKTLLSRGHHVTVISHFKTKSFNPNYTEILIPNTGLPSFVNSISPERTASVIGFRFMAKDLVEAEAETSFRVLNIDYIQKLIHSKSNNISIDLLLIEMYYTKYYHLLAHKLNVSLINILPPVSYPGIDSFINNPFNPSFLPLISNGFSIEMNFLERLINSFQYAIFLFLEKYEYDKNLKEYARKYFSMEMPTITDLNKRVAIGFFNNHFSFLSRPTVPNAIDIGGIHIEKAEKLPKDIEEFLTNSKHGAIYFSFGTTLQISTMSKEKLNTFLDTFRSIPQKVLWKVDDLNITDNLPSNIKLGKWFPQKDILEHEKVVAFISHGGLFGTYEAIYTATPVIGIPLVLDQFLNIKLLAQKNVGIYLDYNSLNKNILKEAIHGIVNNTKYKENMMKLSNVFKDRPQSPIDTAVYWIEYVLKHKGVPFMRTSGADMPLYKYLLLDVITFILISLLSLAYAVSYIVKLIWLGGIEINNKPKTE